MRIVVVHILLILATVASFTASAKIARKEAGKGVPYLEAVLSRDEATEGEKLIYEVILHTPDPAVAGVELSANPDFGNLQASRSAADTHLQEDSGDDHWFTAVIDRFFVNADKKGKVRVRGGEYRIGFGRQVPMEDPFWGPYLADKVDVVSLKAPDCKLKVKELPENGRPEDFSGAVGEYEISVELPEGHFTVGEEAYAVVTITGIGDLSEADLPDIPGIFGEGLQFRSMTESRNHYVSKGHIGSEIEIECVFVPQEEGNFSIDSCRFSFFNPRTFRYEDVESPPVAVSVESAVSGESNPETFDI